MANRVFFWVATTLGAAALLFVVFNAVMVSNNRSLQAEINQNQQTINASVTLAQLNQMIGQALISAAVNNKDAQIRDLLVSQGIQLPNPQQQAQGEKAAPAADKSNDKSKQR